jgi:hypothetical protein
VLIGLFLIHGPPLVLKLDNGSAYRAEAMQKALVGYGVVVLYSPAYTPEYNGSAEAGVGSMKARTEEQAERGGHPGVWTAEAEQGFLVAAINDFSTRPETLSTMDQCKVRVYNNLPVASSEPSMEEPVESPRFKCHHPYCFSSSWSLLLHPLVTRLEIGQQWRISWVWFCQRIISNSFLPMGPARSTAASKCTIIFKVMRGGLALSGWSLCDL